MSCRAAALTLLLAVAGAGLRPAVAADATRTLENAALRLSIDLKTGGWTVVDKRCGHRWYTGTPIAANAPLKNVREVAGGLAFEIRCSVGKNASLPLAVQVVLGPEAADISVRIDAADRTAAIEYVAYPDHLVLESKRPSIVMADYGGGHIYPADEKLPRTGFNMSNTDLPLAIVCDAESGVGCGILLEDPQDARLQLRREKVGQRELHSPVVVWTPSKRQFAYPRRTIFHFTADGGYVALAKRYRRHAAAGGLVATFAEKLKKNPNIARLFGAPDVWGNAGLKFAKEAKAAGVEKMLIHGRAPADEMQAINALGYLTSEYDNYTDALPVEAGKEVDSSHDHIPDNIVLKADGERQKAWLTWDKKKQYMKRCPAMWVPTAQKVIPKLLEKYPFVGRFIDVTTAEDLYECYDPKHPLDRLKKLRCGEALLGYVRSLGLVTGGEHGRWWAVPHLDYIEGMMSGGFASWPAGHLIRPKSKDQEFVGPHGNKLQKWEEYARWGIGHEHRVPLWELVFHDCIVSTWYWGDASDFLLAAAPEITAKKDANNVLYGTIPLLWANKEGSWTTHRAVFLRTYRNTCKFHEVIAGVELMDHRFVTPDRSVQRTRFADTTEVVVNFGPQAYELKRDGQSLLLPQNGFAVQGPKGSQSRVLRDGKIVTTIAFGDYRHTETE